MILASLKELVETPFEGGTGERRVEGGREGRREGGVDGGRKRRREGGIKQRERDERGGTDGKGPQREVNANKWITSQRENKGG